jgi:hypothetical protein
VARGHWTNFARPLKPKDKIYGNQDGRLRLLALLLANADLLDTSAVRAGYFRSNHRLYDLNPLSELHQKMHALVKGFSIERLQPELPDQLTYVMTWRDRSRVVRYMTEWQMRWFSSQMRQIVPELLTESSGTVRWSAPWAKVTLRKPLGPVEELSAAAQAILLHEVTAQRRIDRDRVAARFQEALTGNATAILALIGNVQSDWRYVSDWCEARARAEEGVQVARLDTGSSDPGDLASLIAVVLQQWGRDLSSSGEERAVHAVRDALNQSGRAVLIALQDGRQPDLNRLVELIASANRPDGAARVIVLISPLYPSVQIGGVPVEFFDLSFLEEADVDNYLANRYGYGEPQRRELISAVRDLELLRQPAKVYHYIDLHCDRTAWTTMEES